MQSTLNRVYQALFVPYALIFLIQIAFSALVSSILPLFGLSKRAAVILFILLFAVALFAFLARIFVRAIILTRARRHSPNPKIRRIVEVNTLRFLVGDYVEYSSYMELRATRSQVTEMDVLLAWRGRRSDIDVHNCVGCKITLHESSEFNGLILRLHFPEAMPKRANYPVGYTVLFDNTNKYIKPFLRKVGRYIAEDKITQNIILPERSKYLFVEKIQANAHDGDPVKIRYSTQGVDSHSSTWIRPVQGFSYFVGVVGLD